MQPVVGAEKPAVPIVGQGADSVFQVAEECLVLARQKVVPVQCHGQEVPAACRGLGNRVCGCLRSEAMRRAARRRWGPSWQQLWAYAG
jgi:hypothetical protein